MTKITQRTLDTWKLAKLPEEVQQRINWLNHQIKRFEKVNKRTAEIYQAEKSELLASYGAEQGQDV